MKRIAALGLLLVVALGGWFVVTGGEAQPGNDTPDISPPNTDQAVEASDSFLAWLSTRPEGFWTFVAAVLIGGFGIWLFKRHPALVSLVIGGFAVYVVIRVFA